MSDRVETDAVIIGAGPVGLFAIFELGLLGYSSHIIDIRTKPGGQCAELYPEKPIYDIPALPKVTGQELTDRLIEQAQPFEPVFHFSQMVQAMEKLPDGRFLVTTDADLKVVAKVVVIAAGGGSFLPKRPPIDNIEAYEGKSVFYAVRRMEEFRDHNVVIVGGGDSALDWTLSLEPVASRVTLIHRRPEFRAAPDSVAKLQELIAAGKVDFILGQVEDLVGKDGELSAIHVKKKEDGAVVELACERMLPFFGLTVKLGPIADWGLNLNEERLPVDTSDFSTSEPGIFAIGDIVTYPGKVKLILSGFHEAALMAHGVFKHINPETRLVHQHTTSSSSLQKRLGVS